jgi:hypothetical protein
MWYVRPPTRRSGPTTVASLVRAALARPGYGLRTAGSITFVTVKHYNL